MLNVSNSVVLNSISKYLSFLILILTKFIFDNIPGELTKSVELVSLGPL